MVVSAYPELELVRALGAATHGEDVTHTIVANAGVSQRRHRKEKLSVAKSISLKEGDLKSATLRLHGSDQRVIWIPRNGGLELQTGRVVDVATTFPGQKTHYHMECNWSSFEYTHIC